MLQPFDPYCGRTPSQIEEYKVLARADKMNPDEWVIAEEGTFNPKTNHFACTDCYIKLGQPTAPNGWKCP